MKNLLLVFAGGGIGSVLRYIIGTFMSSTPNSFPWATFTVNAVGSCLIGLFMGLFMYETEFAQNWKLLLITGFCGGFTTFSAFSKESFNLIQQEQWGILSVYILLTVVICIGATALGFVITR